MSKIQQFVIILIVAFATMITRFLPFIVFPANKETPSYIKYLGNVLPAAVLGLLVVYSLKDVSIFNEFHALPEAISIAVIVILHFLEKADDTFYFSRYNTLYVSCTIYFQINCLQLFMN